MSLARAYKVPPCTVQLGTLLDLTIAPDAEHRVRVDEWKGWLVVIPENGFELGRGRSKLFLLKADMLKRETMRAPVRRALERAYERWHMREPDAIATHEVADWIERLQGRVLRIGYRSDKWGPRGKSHDYDHDFLERGGRAPKLYTDSRALDKASAAVLVGGSMTITERGIA